MSHSEMTEQDERDFKNHKKEFDRICEEYKLRSDDAKAGAIADYIMEHGSGAGVNAEDFAKTFELNPADAIIFLSWIKVGIRYDEKKLSFVDCTVFVPVFNVA